MAKPCRELRWVPLLVVGLAVGCPEPQGDARRTVVNVVPERVAPQSANQSANQSAKTKPEPMKGPRDEGETLGRAVVIDRQGNTVGRATFYTVPTGVAVRFQGQGLPPGRRGFHVHEHGVCNPADDFVSAGDHWDPGGREHGHENPEGPHAGDMPNLEVADDGTVDFHHVLPRATLRTEGAYSMVAGNGTSLVIHADEDDLQTDPTGESGPRIACGVIHRAPPD
jgi:superoxide dismutase, Cu-Zn family